jgi:hypothetical protein
VEKLSDTKLKEIGFTQQKIEILRSADLFILENNLSLESKEEIRMLRSVQVDCDAITNTKISL